MSRFDARKLEREILSALSGGGAAATYVIRNRLDHPGRPFYRKEIETRHILRACRRLEREQMISEAASLFVVMKSWRITDAGKQAISMEETA